MADVRDYMSAAHATDDALTELGDLRGILANVPRESRTETGALALALIVSAQAVTCAIREAATRLDYVTREVARR